MRFILLFMSLILFIALVMHILMMFWLFNYRLFLDMLFIHLILHRVVLLIKLLILGNDVFSVDEILLQLLTFFLQSFNSLTKLFIFQFKWIELSSRQLILFLLILSFNLKDLFVSPVSALKLRVLLFNWL